MSTSTLNKYENLSMAIEILKKYMSTWEENSKTSNNHAKMYSLAKETLTSEEMTVIDRVIDDFKYKSNDFDFTYIIDFKGTSAINEDINIQDESTITCSNKIEAMYIAGCAPICAQMIDTEYVTDENKLEVIDATQLAAPRLWADEFCENYDEDKDEYYEYDDNVFNYAVINQTPDKFKPYIIYLLFPGIECISYIDANTNNIGQTYDSIRDMFDMCKFNPYEHCEYTEINVDKYTIWNGETLVVDKNFNYISDTIGLTKADIELYNTDRETFFKLWKENKLPSTKYALVKKINTDDKFNSVRIMTADEASKYKSNADYEVRSLTIEEYNTLSKYI